MGAIQRALTSLSLWHHGSEHGTWVQLSPPPSSAAFAYTSCLGCRARLVVRAGRIPWGCFITLTRQEWTILER